ncbi:MAG: cytochrome P450 [Pseudomonadota bacterium]
MTARFVPVHPPRPAVPTQGWRNLFGANARNLVAGWSELAFDEWHTRRSLLGTVIHFVRHPDMIEHVLLSNAGNYVKPRLVKRITAPMIGKGLLTADGDLWRTQRRIVAPSFAPGAVARLTGLIAAAAERSTAGWPATGRIDIAATATATTMRIIADALFSGDSRLTTPEASRHIEAALLAVGQVRIAALLGFPGIKLSPTAWRGDAGRRYLRGTLTAIVRERGPEGGEDFLGGMIRDLHGRFPAGEAVALAIDNAATFYLAGHETTSNALAWTMYLLATAPAVQDRACAEAVAALAGDAESLPERLPYLRQVLDEAMRLYPPAPRFDREALADDDLGDGITVRKGELVSIWPWLVHRHRKLWDDPDGFDPGRFAAGKESGRHRFQYIPFGGGARVCVGARFAVVEALVILAHWLAARRFTLAEDFVVDPLGSVTLRPRGGIMVDMERA